MVTSVCKRMAKSGKCNKESKRKCLFVLVFKEEMSDGCMLISINMLMSCSCKVTST